VQLPLRTLQGMLTRVVNGEVFGSSFALDSAGAADLPRDILVPGRVVVKASA
jgi:hypothetical protein